MTDKTGGPAFPVPPPTLDGCGGYSYTAGGMTLRDYFAAKAMQGLMQAYWDTHNEYASASSIIKCQAESAYEYADAMLAERQK